MRALTSGFWEQLAKSEELKTQANKKFQENHFSDAIDLYTQAVEHNSSNHILFANRAFCHIKLENYGMHASVLCVAPIPHPSCIPLQYFYGHL